MESSRSSTKITLEFRWKSSSLKHSSHNTLPLLVTIPKIFSLLKIAIILPPFCCYFPIPCNRSGKIRILLIPIRDDKKLGAVSGTAPNREKEVISDCGVHNLSNIISAFAEKSLGFF